MQFYYNYFNILNINKQVTISKRNIFITISIKKWINSKGEHSYEQQTNLYIKIN